MGVGCEYRTVRSAGTRDSGASGKGRMDGLDCAPALLPGGAEWMLAVAVGVGVAAAVAAAAAARIFTNELNAAHQRRVPEISLRVAPREERGALPLGQLLVQTSVTSRSVEERWIRLWITWWITRVGKGLLACRWNTPRPTLHIHLVLRACKLLAEQASVSRETRRYWGQKRGFSCWLL